MRTITPAGNAKYSLLRPHRTGLERHPRAQQADFKASDVDEIGITLSVASPRLGVTFQCTESTTKRSPFCEPDTWILMGFLSCRSLLQLLLFFTTSLIRVLLV